MCAFFYLRKRLLFYHDAEVGHYVGLHVFYLERPFVSCSLLNCVVYSFIESPYLFGVLILHWILLKHFCDSGIVKILMLLKKLSQYVYLVPTLCSISQFEMVLFWVLRSTFSILHTTLSSSLGNDCLFHPCPTQRLLSLPSFSNQYHMGVLTPKEVWSNQCLFCPMPLKKPWCHLPSVGHLFPQTQSSISQFLNFQRSRNYEAGIDVLQITEWYNLTLN